jgi:hypothetical protein
VGQLKVCAEAFKRLQASSTGMLPDDQTTWNIDGYDLVAVVHGLFATLQSIPELR